MSHQNSRGAAFAFLFVPFLIALTVAAAPRAQGQDARAALQKVLETYQKLNSYDGKASAELTVVSNGKTQQTLSAISTQLRVRRPNLLTLNVSTAKGSHDIYCDGRKFIVYDGLHNAYSSAPAVATLSDMVVPLAQRGGIRGEADPLYFLTAKTLPSTLTDLKFLPPGSVNGIAVNIITGTTRAVLRSSTAGKVNPASSPNKTTSKAGAKAAGPKPNVETLYWKWYIDKKTNLLHKIEMHSDPKMVTVRSKQNGKMVERTMPVRYELRHVIVDAQANPTLSDTVFTFRPPTGATLMKETSELLGDKTHK